MDNFLTQTRLRRRSPLLTLLLTLLLLVVATTLTNTCHAWQHMTPTSLVSRHHQSKQPLSQALSLKLMAPRTAQDLLTRTRTRTRTTLRLRPSDTSASSSSPLPPLKATLVDSSDSTNVIMLEKGNKLSDPNNNHNNGDDESGLLIRDKIINGLFLSLAFGYALYTIFSIDQGLTRGWTASEIAMRIPLDNWGAYESYLANKPVITKTLINVIIYLLGDWLSQTVFQEKNVLDFDIGRTLRNGFIGLCFGPLVHEYYQFSDTILPPENGLVTRLEKILMDQTIYLTVKCSIYIGAVGLLGGDDWKTVKETVSTKIGGVVITAWKFWPLVHCITYGLIPARHRILWVNSVDLVWNAILASQAQKTVERDSGDDEDNSSDDDAIDVVVSSSNVLLTESEEVTTVLLATAEEVLVLDDDASRTSSANNSTATVMLT